MESNAAPAMNGRLHALSRLGVGSGRDDISGHSPIGLVMVSRHGLLHGATHGLSPRSFPCFPGSVLPRLHGVAPFFRRRRRPAEDSPTECRDLGCPAVKSSQGSTHSNGPRRGFGGSLGAAFLVDEPASCYGSTILLRIA